MSVLYIFLFIFLIVALCLIFDQSSNTSGGFERHTPFTDYKKDKHILGTFVSKHLSKPPKSSKIPLAKKLSDAGWMLYIKDTCPWCHLQVDMFGTDKQYLNIVDCSKMEPPQSQNPANLDAENCKQLWVYPTWVNGNKILPGSQSFASLNDALNGKFYKTTNMSKSGKISSK